MKQESKYHWEDIYQYYGNGGLYLFIMDRMASLTIGVVLALTPIFIFGMFNWQGIKANASLGDIIFPFSAGWGRTPWYFRVCSIAFLIFDLFQLTQFVMILPSFVELHEYFTKKLHIRDNDLAVTEWNEVVESILVSDSSVNTTALEIAQKVLRTDNYMCAIYSDPSLLIWKLPWEQSTRPLPISRFFDTFFRIAITGPVLDQSGCSMVNGSQSLKVPQLTSSLQFRFKVIGWISLLFLPFILAFQLLYIFFDYIQIIRSSPESLTVRRYTTHALWILREYNEFPHVFNQRIAKSYEWANMYLSRFPSPYMKPIAKTIAFVCGAIMGGIMIVGLFSDISLVFSVQLFQGKTIAWLMTLLASIYAICHSISSPTDNGQSPDELLSEVEKYIYYDFRDDSNSAHSWETQRKVSSFFQPLWQQLLLEVLGVFLNPFLFIVVLPMKAGSIVEFVKKNSKEHADLGWICAFSFFESTDERKRIDGDPSQKLKIAKSISHFNSQVNIGGRISRTMSANIHSDDGTDDAEDVYISQKSEEKQASRKSSGESSEGDFQVLSPAEFTSSPQSAKNRSLTEL